MFITNQFSDVLLANKLIYPIYSAYGYNEEDGEHM